MLTWKTFCFFSFLLKNVMYCNRLFRSFLWTLAYSFLKHVSSALMRLSFDVFFRLRLKFSCMMELSRYPLDRQICDMQIASCKWNLIFKINRIINQAFSCAVPFQFLRRVGNCFSIGTRLTWALQSPSPRIWKCRNLLLKEWFQHSATNDFISVRKRIR